MAPLLVNPAMVAMVAMVSQAALLASSTPVRSLGALEAPASQPLTAPVSPA